MKNKQLLITTILFTLYVSPIKCVIGETIAGFKVAQAGVNIASDYIYNTEENQAILKKHLQPGSYVATGCEKYLSQNCIALAKHYRDLEAYHKASYIIQALEKTNHPELRDIMTRSLIDARKEREKINLPDDNGSYLESLTWDERDKALQLANSLIKEHNGFDRYAEELEYIYNSLNK